MPLLDYFYPAMFHSFFKILIPNSLFGQFQLNYSLIGSPLLEIIVYGKPPHIALLQHFLF